MLYPAYEVHSPSFNDLNLEQQIEYGINDWAAEDSVGHMFYGKTQQEAEQIRASYLSARKATA
jgi:hypothetical protein